MKKLYYFLLAIPCLMVLSFTSCSNDDDTLLPGENEPELEEVFPELVIDMPQNRISIFEDIRIKMKYDRSKQNVKYIEYDSILFRIDNIHKIRIPGGNGLISMSSLENFYYPKSSDIQLRAYKDGKIVNKKDTVLDVYMDGDFLSVKWNEKPYFWTRSTDNIQYFFLDLKAEYIPDSYAVIGYLGDIWNYDKENKEKHHAAGRQWLKNYITSLYKKPVYLYEGEDVTKTPLTEEYNKRFVKEINEITSLESQLYPVAIWDTPTTHIALVGGKVTSYSETLPRYYIIAEPRK